MNNTPLIQELEVVNYRGLSGLTIDNLSQVNIFVGTNNCGKTSILEAVKLISEPSDIAQLVRISLLRTHASNQAKKKNLINYVLNIFQQYTEDKHNYYRINLGAIVNNKHLSYSVDATRGEVADPYGDVSKTLELAVKYNAGDKPEYRDAQLVHGSTSAWYPSSEKPIFEATYFHSSIDYYQSCVHTMTDYIIHEGKETILQILQAFDPSIHDISIIGEDIYLHNKNSGSLPLFAYGSGMQKAVLLTAALIACKDGVVLIDEIDNAIHISAFEEVFRWFMNACVTYNVQAFISTHSAEALDAILRINHEEFSGKDILRIITMRKDNRTGNTTKKIRTGSEAYEDREMFKMELRI